MNTRTQMVLTLVNSAVIILLVYIHIDTGGGEDPSFGQHGGSQGLFGGSGWRGGKDFERVKQGGGDGERGQVKDQSQRAAGTEEEVMRVLRKLQASQVLDQKNIAFLVLVGFPKNFNFSGEILFVWSTLLEKEMSYEL